MQCILPRCYESIDLSLWKQGCRFRQLLDNVNATQTDIFVSLNCDGVPWASSSGQSLYPILGSINGLSAALTKKFTFIAGVWVGGRVDSKPSMQVIFEPVVKQLLALGNPSHIYCRGYKIYFGLL